ncbi:tRNA (guanosine(46)-N7)-methyltransferase TrmB [Mycolicibacterium parafortuitum]|uniref:tRNA (guanine-N(7)-)-methyltransferase n=1 Tax=Mycolicibacterium parafortuitum TaxID=39692 RepID=A0A375YED7_MYCPF|nr:tRNA (guanosine(46)-N7)-methyltransferase TrmB [Mycolicibacterium parafortuitum]ORB30264.1 tRNA (guanosine(46)-N7)-methyltransferase TrmB [Mycolicibacterium parafortuitum]SRX79486.1 putative methyltransferase (methylase) [Mycobacterium tuberculosis H37Rv] [Mycolicibacterium parafortuitum]
MSDHGRMDSTGSEVAASVAPEPDQPDTEAAHPHFHRRVTSFRARRSSISDNQQAVWDRLWPQLGTQARDGDEPAGPLDTTPAGRLDTGAWFGRHAPVILEIGCGTGTSTLAMAQAEPDLDVVAVEVYRKGLAQLLSAIDRTGTTNIRMVRGDGVDVLTYMFGPASLTGVRVFFPDPWPKARHHKRRLLQTDTVALIADRLRPGGVLHAATDHQGYAEHIAEVGDAEPRLRRIAMDSDRLPMSVHRPVTKYERKALAGPVVTELLWERTP